MFDAAGKYIYMADLCKISAMKPLAERVVLRTLGMIATPLIIEAWRVELGVHPDREFVAWLIDGMERGVRIGYDYSRGVGGRVGKNMRSALKHPQPIDQYVQSERAAGRIIRLRDVDHGAFQMPMSASMLHISRIGVIPKPHQPGKWRFITKLSSAKGGSVNDGVSPGLCSVSYASVGNVVRCIMSLGKGALLAKFDITSAYRIIPVHSEDHRLLGVRWRGKLLADGALPFGLRSAPKLFTAVADALLWIMGRHGCESCHALHR